MCSNDPASHPFITMEELSYLEKEMGQLKRHDDLPATPWKDIFTSVPVIALIVAQVKSLPNCNYFTFCDRKIPSGYVVRTDGT